MQTNISATDLLNPDIAEANDILRSCVHCGFCTATCPTYQILGDELDSPRGRIYLIKEMLDGNPVGNKTRMHLDRCLTCRSCETTCPSGVQYGHLIDIGKQEIEKRAPRPLWQKMVRRALVEIIPHTNRFAFLLACGRIFRPILPKFLQQKIPLKQVPIARPQNKHERTMLILEGCVQPVTAPNTNAATAQVLDKLGISLISAPEVGCCGALHQHLADTEGAKNLMRCNIDAWWPLIEQGAEAIVMTASGCGVMVKEYGHALKNDPHYADKAARISALTRDLSEILHDANLTAFAQAGQQQRVAYHSSCTIQHGQQLSGLVENILQRCGYILASVSDSHLCCGAAGTYTILEPKLSQQLLHNKLDALQHEQPQIIVSANIGCQLHLEGAAKVPVKHWIELLVPASTH
jgi:glycolate oxidase iron-sulfur subunit